MELSQETIQKIAELRQQGMSIREISKQLKIPRTTLSKLVAAVEGPAQPVAGPQSPGEGTGVGTGGEPLLPTAYDKFRAIGLSLGIPDPFLGHVSDYIFQLNHEDPGAVQEALQKLALRPDIIQRWTQLWAVFLNKPAPRTDGGGPAGPVVSRRFILVNGTPLPSEDGLYTFQEALQLAATGKKGNSESNEEARLLRAELSRLQETLADEKRQALMNELAEMRQSIAKLAGVVASGKSGSKSELDIMSEFGTAILGEIKEGRKDIVGFVLKNPPRPLTAGERDLQIEAVKAGLQDDDEAMQLARDLGMQPPAEAPVRVPVRVKDEVERMGADLFFAGERSGPIRGTAKPSFESQEFPIPFDNMVEAAEQLRFAVKRNRS
jgi:hypothetical protein